MYKAQREEEEKYYTSMLTYALYLAEWGLLFGMVRNMIQHRFSMLITVEIILLIVNGLTIFLLKKNPQWRERVASFFTLELILFFTLLYMTSHPEDLKVLWLYTFPAALFYFNGLHRGLWWAGVQMALVVAAFLQPWYPVAFTLDQTLYLLVVFMIEIATIRFFQMNVEHKENLVLRQSLQLQGFNKDLESRVARKTAELEELNASLEERVQSKIKEIIKKDEMLIFQSRQVGMGEMLSMITHQWRQPLSTITLSITNLKFKQMLGTAKPEEVDKVLDQISDNIIYLSDTIDDFHNYFKPDKERETIESCHLVERVINLIHARYESEQIHLQFVCVESFEFQTYINELTQVLINIFNNAADALDENKVQNKSVTVSIKKEDDTKLKIEIEDNGGGIKESVLSKLFEPYFSTKAKNGTGLGMYMAKTIIETHLNGVIMAENKNEGASFVIELPL